MNFYVETTTNGNERTVFTDQFRCGDAPECHDETKPCGCRGASMTTIVTESGRRKQLPEGLDPARVAGLDEDGRIVVDDFDARNPEKSGKFTDGAGAAHDLGVFMFGLTLCCNASDKGVEDGIVCRGCYGTQDVGNYLYREDDGSFPGLDPIKEVVTDA